MSPSISRRQVIAGTFALAVAGRACLRAVSEGGREPVIPPSANVPPQTNPYPLIGDIAERTW